MTLKENKDLAKWNSDYKPLPTKEEMEHGITPHVLRHTGATLMAQNGVSMVDIAGIMGDRIYTIEKHYLKYHPDYLKNATSALDGIYA